MLKAFYLKTIGVCIGLLSFRLGFFILIVTYSWLGYNTNAELVFYVLTCFGDLRDILAFDVPGGLFQAAELCATLKRINRVLNLEESNKIKNLRTIKPCVRLKNVSVTVKDTAILKNISLCISSGLTLVSGSIGSGKSSLVKTILKHYQITDGELLVKGRISYASQDAWIFPSSIRQNILFGEAFDKSRYDEVLRVCALKLDIDLFDNGDETILSDNGNNLSKGQQSRINLARAVYKDSDIYLIDDSLAALDTNVQDYIFNKCIKGYLKDKIVILVTQNMKHILQGDKVVILEDGEILSSGIPKDINIEDVLKIKNYVDENDSVKNNEKNNKLKEEEIEESNEESVLKAEVAKKSKIYQEFKKSGNVSLDVYWKYIKFGGNIFVCIFIFLLYFCSAYSDNFSQVLLADW